MKPTHAICKDVLNRMEHRFLKIVKKYTKNAAKII